MALSVPWFQYIAPAAEVTRINEGKGLVVINGSKDAGFVMGAIVCFYSDSGEEITCGRVQQTSEGYATVKVNKRKARQILFGMDAELVDPKKEGGASESTREKKPCVDDSECREGYCVNGKCQESKVW